VTGVQTCALPISEPITFPRPMAYVQSEPAHVFRVHCLPDGEPYVEVLFRELPPVPDPARWLCGEPDGHLHRHRTEAEAAACAVRRSPD